MRPRFVRVMVAAAMRRPSGQLSISWTLLLLLLAFASLQGMIALGAALRVAWHGVSFEVALDRVMSEPFGPGLAQLAALGFTIFVGVRVAYGDRALREALHVKGVPSSVIGLAALAGLATQFPVAEATAIVSDIVPSWAHGEEIARRIEQMTRIDGPMRAITVPLTIVVIAPLTEELLFRGLVVPAIAPRLGALGAVLFTALLFGIFHVDPLVAIGAGLAGLVLGWIAVRTDSVVPCIAFHAAFNAVPVLLPQALVPIAGWNEQESEHLPWPLVAVASVIAAAALVALHRRTRPPSDSGAA